MEFDGRAGNWYIIYITCEVAINRSKSVCSDPLFKQLLAQLPRVST